MAIPHFNPDNFQPSLEDQLFEMANLSLEKTGLPFIVWISPGMNNPRDIRIKVSRTPRPAPVMTSVALRPEVRVIDGEPLSRDELTKLRAWVSLNWDVLVDFWDGRIEYTEDATARIRSIA